MFNPPTPWGTPDPLEKLLDDPSIPRGTAVHGIEPVERPMLTPHSLQSKHHHRDLLKGPPTGTAKDSRLPGKINNQ